MFLMRFRHMLNQGGVLALLETPLVRYNASVVKEDFYGINAEEGLYPLAGKLIGDTIEMLVDFNVIIDIDLRLLKANISVPLGREGL